MGGMGMPSMLDKMGAGVDFEELSTAGTEFSGPPAYTVTSPRPSVDNTGSGYKFTVQPTPDFKPSSEDDVKARLTTSPESDSVSRTRINTILPSIDSLSASPIRTLSPRLPMLVWSVTLLSAPPTHMSSPASESPSV